MATAQWLNFTVVYMHSIFFLVWFVLFSQTKKGCDKLENACHLTGVKVAEDFIHHFAGVTSLLTLPKSILLIKAKHVQSNKSLRFIVWTGFHFKVGLDKCF